MGKQPKTVKKRITNNAEKPYEQKIERKFNVARYPPKPIPKHVLNRTLQIVNDPKDEFWLKTNTSCVPSVHTQLTNLYTNHSDTYEKLDLARKCLLTRDWKNLAKLLTSNLICDNILQKSAYPIFSEYCTILLSLEDQELLKILQPTMAPSVLHPTNNQIKTETLKPTESDEANA